MGIKRITKNGVVSWRVDTWLKLVDGRLERFRESNIPTKEMALALERKKKTEAFEGRHFDKKQSLTVEKAWTKYAPKGERDNRAWATDKARAQHLLRHLGPVNAEQLRERHVEEYRQKRSTETTKRGHAPTAATLDREVELLKRVLNYNVRLGLLTHNPIAHAPLLNKPNTRSTTLTQDDFEALVNAAKKDLRAVLVVAHETGMRKEELLSLTWQQVDLKNGTIRLEAQDTKTERARLVVLTQRALQTLKALPRKKRHYVFNNPKTGTRWQDIRKAFAQACKDAGLKNVWFHDQRRTFVTNARKAGVPESVVMRMSGHRSRKVFDRYNIVDHEDLKNAVRMIEKAAS